MGVAREMALASSIIFVFWILTFTRWNWKWYVINVIKTDLFGFVFKMHWGLCQQYDKSEGRARNAFCPMLVPNNTSKMLNSMCTVPCRYSKPYAVSHKIYGNNSTWLRLFWVGADRFEPNRLMLHKGHWRNRMITPVAVSQPLMLWVNWPNASTTN